MIKPSNGRIVLFTPAHSDTTMVRHGAEPLAAIVTHVWGDRCINVAAFDANGNLHAHTSVTLLQDDDAKPEHGRFATWMPYQKGQAAKTEALEQKLADSSATA